MSDHLLPLAVVPLAIVLAVAVATDLRTRRIPNRLVLAGLAAGFMLHAATWSLGAASLAGPSAWSPLAGAVTGLLALMPLYLLRACGAADAKLMAVVGAFVGAKVVLAAALYTLLAGGVLAIVYMLMRGVAAQTLANVARLMAMAVERVRSGHGARFEPLQHTAARLPYALAIAAGTLLALRWPLVGSG